MINCIIIEDQPPAQRILKKYINDIDFLELRGTFSDVIQAMEFMNSETVDLLFLDIHLPKISGIEFLKSMPNHPNVILTTAFSEYALESYEYKVVDYLLKPFSFQRFVKAISKIPSKEKNTEVNKNNELEENDTLFIKSGYDHIKIKVSEIIYIKSEADYTEIITQNKKHLTSFSLKYWLEKLAENKFTQVHKSYIINGDFINKISGNQIILTNEMNIPIGRAYKEQFVEKYLS